jgi:hypothetical protein
MRRNSHKISGHIFIRFRNGESQPMGKDSKAEFLARKTRRKELIEKSEKRIEHSTNLLNQSHRLIRMALGHHIGKTNNDKTDQNSEPTECGRDPSYRSPQ